LTSHESKSVGTLSNLRIDVCIGAIGPRYELGHNATHCVHPQLSEIAHSLNTNRSLSPYATKTANALS
jgi:hypothetical protein